MTSPTTALLWAIWRRHRASLLVIAGVTALAWFIYLSERSGRLAGAPPDPSPLVEMLAIFTFLLAFGVFGYVETSTDKGIGQFPRRLFTLPVSSLRLVAVPAIAGIASVELLYALWKEPLSRGEPTSALFTGVLLAAFMVFFQAVLWTLDRAGALRIVVAGTVGVLVFVAGLLPTFPPTPPPIWRTEGTLTVIVGALASAVFVISWRHVARMRAGGGATVRWFDVIGDAITKAWPERQQPFPTASAAQFWFEWRSSGAVLPVLVAGVIVVALLPLSWNARADGGETLRLLLLTLATPIGLAIPVGMAAAKPTFWSEDLSVPAFIAVRPLSAEDIVASKMKVAAASAAIAWAIQLAFVVIWLSLWGNLDALSRLALQVWAFHGRSMAMVYGLAALILVSAALLTWRCLVSRLWTGLSGRRGFFMGSVVSVPLVVLAILVFDATRLPGWVLADPARMQAIAWMLSCAVIAKYWLAARSWRRAGSRYVGRYLLAWGAGTACFVVAGLLVWRIVRVYVALDVTRFQTVVILLSLLAMPLARVGLASSSLARNRHRQA